MPPISWRPYSTLRTSCQKHATVVIDTVAAVDVRSSITHAHASGCCSNGVNRQLCLAYVKVYQTIGCVVQTVQNTHACQRSLHY